MSGRSTAEIVAECRLIADTDPECDSILMRDIADRLNELDAEKDAWEMHARRLFELVKTLVGREPQPSDGPDYHADHVAWLARLGPAIAGDNSFTIDEIAVRP